jgi:hypothetical protein
VPRWFGIEIVTVSFEPKETVVLSTPFVVTKLASVALNDLCADSTIVDPSQVSVTAPLVQPVPELNEVHFDWAEADVIPVMIDPAGTPIASKVVERFQLFVSDLFDPVRAVCKTPLVQLMTLEPEPGDAVNPCASDVKE